MKPLNQKCKNEKGQEITVLKISVLCKDTKELMDYVSTRRSSGSAKLSNFAKIGMDGGGGFLKVCLNIVESDEHSPTASPLKKKAAMFKCTGVKKLLIIGLIQNTSENYDNVRELLNVLDIRNIDFCIATDLKLSNILIGIQGHSSTFPCTWCEGSYPWIIKVMVASCELNCYLGI